MSRLPRQPSARHELFRGDCCSFCQSTFSCNSGAYSGATASPYCTKIATRRSRQTHYQAHKAIGDRLVFGVASSN
jgi:hypothetical protein